MKKRIQINLSEEAHEELKRRAEAAKTTRQDLIERWLTETPATVVEEPKSKSKLERTRSQATAPPDIEEEPQGTLYTHTYHSGSKPVLGCPECARLKARAK